MTTTDSIQHLCVGCGNLVGMCTCDPSGQSQHETELTFRRDLRKRLKGIEEKIDDLLVEKERPLMSTVCRDGICYIDGPPMSRFAIVENSDGSGQRIEVIYRVLKFVGSKESCEEARDLLLYLVVSELQNLHRSATSRFPIPIVWWRRRPQISENESDWSFYCRLATTPPLPEDFWQRWETPEGSTEIRLAGEVTGG